MNATITKAQHASLEEMFAVNPDPNTATVNSTAKLLALKKRTVREWFTIRRTAGPASGHQQHQSRSRSADLIVNDQKGTKVEKFIKFN
jgi:hypothetical protein